MGHELWARRAGTGHWQPELVPRGAGAHHPVCPGLEKGGRPWWATEKAGRGGIAVSLANMQGPLSREGHRSRLGTFSPCRLSCFSRTSTPAVAELCSNPAGDASANLSICN